MVRFGNSFAKCTGMTTARRKWMIVLLLGAVLGVYANSLRAPFIFDDDNAIGANPYIRHLWPPVYLFSAPNQSTVAGRPLVSLTLALNYAISGMYPWSYHAVNVVLHACCVLLLFGIMRRTLEFLGRKDADGLAFAIAILWAVHPLLTESVTYIVQRTEVLMGLFYLLTLYCVIRGWHMGAVVACAAGMASKEVMVTAPLVVLLYDRTFLAGSFREAFRQRGKLYVTLAATWLVLAAFLATGPRNETVGFGYSEASPPDYARTQIGVIAHYLRLAVWPYPLVVDYTGWPLAKTMATVWPQAVVVFALLALTSLALYRRKPLGFLGAWFFMILAPTSSVVPIVTEIAAERRMYLSLVAVVVLIVLCVKRALRLLGNRYFFASMTLMTAGLGSMTVLRNADYRSALAIWSDTVSHRPNNARAMVNLGAALADAGRVNEAVTQYGNAIRADPVCSEAYFNRANLMVKQGRSEEALADFRKTLELVPTSALANYYFGLFLVSRGNEGEATSHLEQAAELAPRNAEFQDSLGAMLASQGKVAEALPYFEKAVRLSPDLQVARDHLATALKQLGRSNDTQQAPDEGLRHSN